MKSLWDKTPLRNRYILAVLAGVVLASSFPKLGVAGLAWIAPALMLAASLGKPAGDRFRIGYIAGLAHYLVSLYWLLLIPYRWHGMPLGPAVGWLALSGFLALGPATWVWMASRTGTSARVNEGSVADSLGDETELEAHRSSSLRGPAAGLVPASWIGRTLWALGGAAAWVAMEMTLARILGGFPWNLLGDSQYQMTLLIQIASLTGVYGLSFLMVWFSLGLLCAGLKVLRRPATKSLWTAEILLPMLAVAMVFNFGLRHLRRAPQPARFLTVMLVQPSIPQTLIWDSDKNGERFQEVLRLCDQALTNQADLVVWPEAAIPELLRYDEKTALALSAMAQRHHVWMVVSADDFEPRPGAVKSDEGNFYNASFLIDPNGRLTERNYRKRNLVIFGEYIPWLRWLPFLKWFTPIQGGFTPGKAPGIFVLPDLEATASVLICFEDVFPQLEWGAEASNVDFLVNLTNDGWFGEGAEQWQHAASALFRAVERGLPLVRCANNGITCWIDAEGRFGQIFQDPAGSVHGRGVLTAEIPLPAAGSKPQSTFYSRHGDWFGWGCVGLTTLRLLGILGEWRARSRLRRQAELC